MKKKTCINNECEKIMQEEIHKRIKGLSPVVNKKEFEHYIKREIFDYDK